LTTVTPRQGSGDSLTDLEHEGSHIIGQLADLNVKSVQIAYVEAMILARVLSGNDL
jgi:hypothetical protein